MCECLLTKREAAKLIKYYRDRRGQDAQLQLFEHLVWIFAEAAEDVAFDNIEITSAEVEEIFDDIQVL